MGRGLGEGSQVRRGFSSLCLARTPSPLNQRVAGEVGIGTAWRTQRDSDGQWRELRRAPKVLGSGPLTGREDKSPHFLIAGGLANGVRAEGTCWEVKWQEGLRKC